MAPSDAPRGRSKRGTWLIGNDRRRATFVVLAAIALCGLAVVAPPARGSRLILHDEVWTAHRHEAIATNVVRRYDPGLPPGASRTLFVGRPGLREVTVRYVRHPGGRVGARVLTSRLVRAPQARVEILGIDEYEAFARLAQRGFDKTVGLERSALRMIATAYTASCDGCSGITRSGVPAGHGVVAVDPAVIPLGTRLFIPGYGAAVAGDTGGAIVGRHIDLGFNSLADALEFGRRAIVVYVLR